MIGLLLRIKKKVDCCGTGLHPSTMQIFEKDYDRIVKKGFLKKPRLSGNDHKRGRKKKIKVQNLVNRFEKYKNEIIAFMLDVSVPFNNNQVKWGLRMVKVQQKISGCFRNEKGAQIFCRIRVYISTERKNGIIVNDSCNNRLVS